MEMTGKQRAMEILEVVPNDASWEEALDAFLLDHELEQSIADVERGAVISHDELFRKLAKKRLEQA